MSFSFAHSQKSTGNISATNYSAGRISAE